MNESTVNKLLEVRYLGGLNEIVRLHKDELKLEQATETDLSELKVTITNPELKAVLESGFIYKWVDLKHNSKELYIVGHRANPGYLVMHSSELVGFDPISNIGLTSSGSYYKLLEFIDPSTDENLLRHICAFFHYNGEGEYYGVLRWTFQ